MVVGVNDDQRMSLRPLDYAPGPSWLRRRVVQRVAMGAAILVALGAGWWLAPGAWRHFQVQRLQGQCLSYTKPADHEVVRDSNRYNNSAVPKAWRELFDAIVVVPPGMFKLGNGPPGSGGTLFLHERVSPSGNRRLVAVDVGASDLYGFQSFPPSYQAQVIKPGSLFTAPRDVSPDWRSTDFPAAKRYTRFFAGQPDPDDRSHFTIRLVGDGSETIVDGWLRDDETVVLKARPSKRVVP